MYDVNVKSSTSNQSPELQTAPYYTHTVLDWRVKTLDDTP